MKNKKALYITLGSIDAALTLFLFAISIVMLVTMPSAATMKEWKTAGSGHPANFIEYFQMNSTVYLLVGVIPLFILLAVNIVVVFYMIKRAYKKKQVTLQELSADQKEELRKELLKDLNEK